MMDDFNKKARGQSLQDLMAAMDEDSAAKIPKLQKPAVPEAEPEGDEGEPLLTIKIMAHGGADEGEPDDAPEGDHAMGDPGSTGDPFEDLIRRKKAGG